MAEDTRVPESRENHLKITEIFYSLQGEARDIGWPTVFIRLTGCPLRCQYCDTAYAFYGGAWMHFDEILAEVGKYSPSYICVTGGEPLAQKRSLELLRLLCDQGYNVSLETSGAISVKQVDSRVSKILDIKTPDSGESHRNLWDNLDSLNTGDQIKFVICSQRDYRWCLEQIDEKELIGKVEIIFSPSYDEINPRELAEWVLRDQLQVRVQIQLHKQLWGDSKAR